MSEMDSYQLAEGKAVMLAAAPRAAPPALAKDGYAVCVEQSIAYKWLDEAKSILEHRNGDKFRVFLAPWNWKASDGTTGVEDRWHMQKIQED